MGLFNWNMHQKIPQNMEVSSQNHQEDLQYTMVYQRVLSKTFHVIAYDSLTNRKSYWVYIDV